MEIADDKTVTYATISNYTLKNVRIVGIVIVIVSSITWINATVMWVRDETIGVESYAGIVILSCFLILIGALCIFYTEGIVMATFKLTANRPLVTIPCLASVIMSLLSFLSRCSVCGAVFAIPPSALFAWECAIRLKKRWNSGKEYQKMARSGAPPVPQEDKSPEQETVISVNPMYTIED
jgi:hypothetical protein